MNIVYLNGQFVPIEAAKVSVLDRGFLFADSIYEVISIYNGKLFRVEEHLKRLQKSAKTIHLQLPYSKKKWLALFHELLKCNHIQNKNKSLYLQITRGAEKKRSFKIPEPPIQPTVFIMIKELRQPRITELKQGVKIILREDIRWKYTAIKSTTLLPNILLQEEAKQANAEDVILTTDQHVIEGSNSNIFIVKNKTIYTPPLSKQMVGGITRELILELCRQHALCIKEEPIFVKDLYNADEVWISSSSREVMPIVQVDEQRINNGKPGPMWKIIHTLFQDFKKTL